MLQPLPVQTDPAAVAVKALGHSDTLEEHVVALSALGARMLDAENCSITLFATGVFRGDADAAPADEGEALAQDDLAISGEAPALGMPSPVDDVDARAAELGPQHGQAGSRAISSQLSIDGQLLGLIHLSDPKSKASFDPEDLNLLQVLALYISRSIQVVQLKNVLRSRFAQLALMHGIGDAGTDALVQSAQQPEQLRRLIVRSFYREMERAGFGPRQIIDVASEIIAELTKSLRRHSKRLQVSEKSQ